jgi:hypothetical protein
MRLEQTNIVCQMRLLEESNPALFLSAATRGAPIAWSDVCRSDRTTRDALSYRHRAEITEPLGETQETHGHIFRIPNKPPDTVIRPFGQIGAAFGIGTNGVARIIFCGGLFLLSTRRSLARGHV